MSLDYTGLKAELVNDPLARGYAPMTDTQVATSLNTRNRTVLAIPALLVPSTILNQCTQADLNALTQLQVSQLSCLLSGGVVDVSQGSTIRAAIRSIFSGKTTTLTNLAALVSPYDSPPQISRAVELGWPSDLVLGSNEVAYARSLS